MIIDKAIVLSPSTVRNNRRIGKRAVGGCPASTPAPRYERASNYILAKTKNRVKTRFRVLLPFCGKDSIHHFRFLSSSQKRLSPHQPDDEQHNMETEQRKFSGDND